MIRMQFKKTSFEFANVEMESQEVNLSPKNSKKNWKSDFLEKILKISYPSKI